MKQLSVEYEDYIHSPEWFGKRKEVFKLKGKICERCKSERRLHVHHKTYVNFTKEDIEKDLCVLCTKCHDLYHKLNKHTSIHTTNAFILDIKVIKTNRRNKRPKKEKKLKNYIFTVGKRKHTKVSRMKLHNPNNKQKVSFFP